MVLQPETQIKTVRGILVTSPSGITRDPRGPKIALGLPHIGTVGLSYLCPRRGTHVTGTWDGDVGARSGFHCRDSKDPDERDSMPKTLGPIPSRQNVPNCRWVSSEPGACGLMGPEGEVRPSGSWGCTQPHLGPTPGDPMRLRILRLVTRPGTSTGYHAPQALKTVWPCCTLHASGIAFLCW